MTSLARSYIGTSCPRTTTRGSQESTATADRFERNWVSGNGGDGLEFVSLNRSVVAANRVEDNGQTGILVQDGVSDNQVLRNRVVGNGHAGIVVFEGTRQNRVETW